jgi:hypothetical protein
MRWMSRNVNQGARIGKKVGEENLKLGRIRNNGTA